MKRAVIVVSFLLLLSLVIAADNFGYNNPNLPLLGGGGNITFETVNNSIYWGGFAYDPLRWLNIDGSNANQDIDISPYELTAASFVGDGSQLTNLPLFNPFNQSLNTSDNVTFQNVNVASNITAVYSNVTNGTYEYLNVTKDLFVSNSTIYVGNVSISSLETFEGKKILSIGDDDTFVEAFGYFGDGGFLDNISFINGSVIALNFLTNGTFQGGNFTGWNFTGLNFFGGNFFGTYDWTAESPYLDFNGTFLDFNESAIGTDFNFTALTLNGTTITDWSEVNYTTTNNTVIYTTTSFTGSQNFVVPDSFNFEIAQIIVTPSNAGNYRFGMYERGSGETIDANLINHNSEWNIFKSYPINNQVTLNFTNVAPANDFTVTIKYFTSQPN